MNTIDALPALHPSKGAMLLPFEELLDVRFRSRTA